ncbi:MAG: single-stranded-DNA-specific exonuclease RecJ [Christensenellales bacterium]|nr:single-stranded-DNA-specific exonuclease RecJ [Christensenellales bacterium]
MLRLIPKNQQKRQIPPELASLGLPERLLELLLDREIDTPEKIERYLHPKREDLVDPMLMQDMDKAVNVIRDAIEKHEEITVFGDYDVDGVTATAILLTYLRKQGAQVGFYIPDRHGEGYGLNIAAIEQIATHSKLLITVDCGITCAAEVARAKELGMRVIVTDHHQLGPQIPECEAVLNPLLGHYPFRRLCGAGVAFKLVQAMGGTEAIEPLWELAALATIADIVPLMDENRVIVYYGLAAMAATQRPGLIALMESAGVDLQKVSSSDVAFRMAPRINAGGRLALASRGVQLLTTRRMDTAREIAEELNQDNIRRRELEIEIFQQADEMTRQQIDFMNERAIVVCGEGWNPGVIGLAASRLVEKYKWPTILLSRDGDICVGSARSIPGVNIHEAMSTCRDLFIRFGGHAQAAGLTIEAKNVPEFKRRLSEAIREQAAPEAFIPTEEYDLELELSEMTEAFVDAFSAMQPTGFGNPAPVFCVRGVHTTDVRTIGKDGAHLRMRLAQGSDMRSAIGFRMGDRAANLPEVIEAIITLSINVWQDKRSVQCELRQMQAYMPGKAFIAECQRQSEKISNAMLSTLCLPDQKAENIERMTLEQAKTVLASEFEKGYQGILIGVHTLAALKLLNVHLAVMHAQLDYVLEKTEDIRGFNTLVMVPDWANIAFSPRLIVAMDGMLSDGERVLVKEKFPKARVIEVTDMRTQSSSAACRLLPDDSSLRQLYKALRQREKTDCTMNVLSAATGLEEDMIRCGMRIMQQLGLIEYTLYPLSFKVLPSGKVSLEDSSLRAKLIRMKDEGGNRFDAGRM